MKTILFLLAIFSVGSLGFASEGGTFKLALVLPLSTTAGAMEQRQAMQMALEEETAAGPLLPGVKVELEAFEEPAELEKVQALASRLVADPQVLGVVGHAGPYAGEAAVIYSALDLCLVAPFCTEP